jgi:outer membrane biosynthesis protein TonB
MNFDNPVKIALIISAIFHGFLFFSFPNINFLFPKIPDKEVEITYYKVKEPYPPAPVKIKSVASRKPAQTAPLKKSSAAQKQRSEDKIRQLKAKKTAPKVSQPKKEIPQPIKNDMVIPPLPKGVEKMPVYLDYVQSVREKIKSAANAKSRQPYVYGEVLLSFVLQSNGRLALVKVIDERSCSNEQLKNIARESIEEASPFEPFPPDLDFNELSFSVVLSFE